MTAPKLRVFIPFAMGYFLSYLFRVVNAVIAPDLAADIGVDPSQLGLLTSAYFISFASFQLPLGVLLDRFDPRKIEASLLVFAAAGAVVFAKAESLRGLVIGRALMARPKLMLLDEPSLGLAPLLVQEIYEIIQKINAEQKMAILLVEQNVRAALAIADYGHVLENGRVVLSGPAENLRDNEDIREFYMGLSAVGSQKSYREVKHYRRRKRWLG